MSKSHLPPSLRNSDNGERFVRLIAALADTADVGMQVAHIGSEQVPFRVMSADEIYRLTHEWETNRSEIANLDNMITARVNRLREVRPDSTGQVVDGV